MRRIHHVNLGVPPELMKDEAEFLVDVLGYQQVEPPPEAQRFGAAWFDADDGTQVHLSRDPDHRPAARAHTALVVGDELDDIRGRLDASGADYDASEQQGMRMVFCFDPAGNRWELRGT
ncbi:MAG TPA: VOC family protein [Acidimicrobiales bacterium]